MDNSAQTAPAHLSEKHAAVEQTLRATLNILEDFDGEKKRLEQGQRATLNILEDFDGERKRLEQGQRATLNILEDFDGERKRLEQGQRATLNILEDFDGERKRLEQGQRATLNILEDFEEEKAKVEVANLALEAANRELEAFSYSVSHDLRAPLRQIHGFARVITERYGSQLDGQGQFYLQRVEEGAQRMGRLIDDLLNLARLGRRELRRESTRLTPLVEEVRQELSAEYQGRNVEWHVQRLYEVQCDRGLIRQVFANLLGNSLKYTRPRERAVIEVGQRAQNGERVIYVRDNGVGFNMKYADKLFGVFQRLHRTDEFEGTGVGLATVQRIVHKHGGRIWAESELGQGATFSFTLGTQSNGQPREPTLEEARQ